jgi:hypothetical protein
VDCILWILQWCEIEACIHCCPLIQKLRLRLCPISPRMPIAENIRRICLSFQTSQNFSTHYRWRTGTSTIRHVTYHWHVPVIGDLRFRQYCFGRFTSSGMWHYVLGQVVSGILKAVQSLSTLEPLIQWHSIMSQKTWSLMFPSAWWLCAETDGLSVIPYCFSQLS